MQASEPSSRAYVIEIGWQTELATNRLQDSEPPEYVSELFPLLQRLT